MKTTLHVHYSVEKYVEGFRFSPHGAGIDGWIYLGAIEIDNPFDAPDSNLLNKAKAGALKDQIKEHKAQINVLENMVKDLLCIESVEAVND